jgi:hypothetical protein
MTSPSLTHLVHDFKETTIARWEAKEKGDTRNGIAYTKQYYSSGREIINKGADGVFAMEDLCLNDDERVRLSAACMLIMHKPHLATIVLEYLTEETTGDISARASAALDVWKEGKWLA